MFYPREVPDLDPLDMLDTNSYQTSDNTREQQLPRLSPPGVIDKVSALGDELEFERFSDAMPGS